MTFADKSPHRSWRDKFACAFHGVWLAMRTQVSFFAHLFVAAAVVVLATALGCGLTEWCLLGLCIAGVLSAETFNTALERMAKAITLEHDENIGDALDISSAAVLLAALGSSAVGLGIIGRRMAMLLGWWTG